MIRNNKKISFFLISLFLIFSCSHENLTIYGRVFLEDPSSNSNKDIIDYVKGNSGITIRSGNISTTTDSDGYFRLQGHTIEDRTILLEISKSGYQTAYRKVYIEHIYGRNPTEGTIKFLEIIGNIIANDDDEIEEDVEYKERPTIYHAETSLKKSIELKSGIPNTNRHPIFNNTTGSSRNNITSLKNNGFYILLLKEASNNNWNIFEYAD